MEDFVELLGSDAQDGGLLVDQLLVEHIHGHVERSDTGALADTALQHPELAVLDGELDVLHVGEVVLQVLLDLVEFLVNCRHSGFQRCQVAVMVVLGGFVQRVRGTDAGHDVLALCVDEPFAVELVLTGSRVAGEGHARSGGLTHVAEYHGLYVHSGAPVVGNTLDAAVSDGAAAVPGFEHGTDAAPELSLGVIGEFCAQHLLDADLEGVAKRHQVFRGEVGIALVTLGFLDICQHIVQLDADALAVFRLDALGLLHHDVGVHHDEAAVSVVDETRVVGLFNEARNGCGAKADVQHGLHHARHRAACARTAGDEEGILRIAELLAHNLFGLSQCGVDIFLQSLRVLAAEFEILGAASRGDGEAGRNRNADLAHLGQVGTLATQLVTHRAVTFGTLSAEAVNSLCHI